MLSRVLLGISLWPLTSAAEVWPNPNWLTKTPEAAGIDRALLEQARDYALSGGGSGYVIHRGYLVFSWGDPAMLYEVKSVTKSIGVMALGLAVGDGLLTLGALADENHVDFANPPASNEQTGWIRLVDVRPGPPHRGLRQGCRLHDVPVRARFGLALQRRGGHWLAEVLTLANGEDSTRCCARGCSSGSISPVGSLWRDNWHRPDLIEGIKRRELGSGISSVDASRASACSTARRRLAGGFLAARGFVVLLGRRTRKLGSRRWIQSVPVRRITRARCGGTTPTERFPRCRPTHSGLGATATIFSWWCRASTWSWRAPEAAGLPSGRRLHPARAVPRSDRAKPCRQHRPSAP